ncbi:MAG: M48 family metallopeptidase [Eubacteriales bacterium]|nr:M48 family metallopeptidase [Eubacteriales bacterium]
MSYQIIRSQRRTIALEVTRDAHVVVRAPLHASDEAVSAFVSAHEQWLSDALERRIAHNAAHPELTVAERKSLITRAKTEIPQRVAYWSRIMALTPTDVKITSAKMRFGSCSAKNSLCFSWYLMQYPDSAIDYVVVHELAHIRHHNHSPAFYALIEQYLPDWRERMALLKE